MRLWPFSGRSETRAAASNYTDDVTAALLNAASGVTPNALDQPRGCRGGRRSLESCLCFAPVSNLNQSGPEL